jgi:SAM-dependent methyltransferase
MTAGLLARYLLAAQVVKGRTVVDAGCADGDGTRILAEGGADRAIGVHLGPGPLPDARRTPRAEGRFLASEAHRLGLVDGAADVVVCFEVLESAGEPESVLDELRRVLAPDGLLIVSCPTRGAGLGYTAAHLARALSRRFRRVELLSQQGAAASIVCDDARTFGTGAWAEAGAVVRTAAPLAPADETHAVAVASDAGIPSLLGVVVLDEPSEIRAWQDRLAAADGELQEARAALARWRAAEARLQGRLRTLGEQLFEAERVNARVLPAEASAERLAAEAERLAAEVERLAAEAEQRRAEAERRTAEAEQRTAEAEQRTAEAEQRTAATAAEMAAAMERWRVEVARAHAAVEQARGEAAGAVAAQERLEARLHHALTEVVALRTSRSWALTAPLRALGRWARWLADRGPTEGP